MSFPDAVAALAQDSACRSGIGQSDRPKPPPACGNALEQAAQFYKKQLNRRPRAIDYLNGAG